MKTLFVAVPLAAVLIAQLAFAKTSTRAAERGRYIVESVGCSDCHTPMRFDAKLGMPVPDRERFLSGHPAGAPVAETLPGGASMAVGATATSFRFPFGIVYAANLTPDETGLKGWTEKMFVDAMRTGRHMGGTGRPIYPPMPWPSIRNLSDDDLRSVFAYLQTIKPVKNDVPELQIPPPVEQAVLNLNHMIATPNPAR